MEANENLTSVAIVVRYAVLHDRAEYVAHRVISGECCGEGTEEISLNLGAAAEAGIVEQHADIDVGLPESTFVPDQMIARRKVPVPAVTLIEALRILRPDGASGDADLACVEAAG